MEIMDWQNINVFSKCKYTSTRRRQEVRAEMLLDKLGLFASIHNHQAGPRTAQCQRAEKTEPRNCDGNIYYISDCGTNIEYTVIAHHT